MVSCADFPRDLAHLGDSPMEAYENEGSFAGKSAVRNALASNRLRWRCAIELRQNAKTTPHFRTPSCPFVRGRIAQVLIGQSISRFVDPKQQASITARQGHTLPLLAEHPQAVGKFGREPAVGSGDERAVGG